MQFSPGMSRFDRANKQDQMAAREKYARGRMPAAPVMAATGKEHDVSLQA